MDTEFTSAVVRVLCWAEAQQNPQGQSSRVQKTVGGLYIDFRQTLFEEPQSHLERLCEITFCPYRPVNKRPRSCPPKPANHSRLSLYLLTSHMDQSGFGGDVIRLTDREATKDDFITVLYKAPSSTVPVPSSLKYLRPLASKSSNLESEVIRQRNITVRSHIVPACSSKPDNSPSSVSEIGSALSENLTPVAS